MNENSVQNYNFTLHLLSIYKFCKKTFCKLYLSLQFYFKSHFNILNNIFGECSYRDKYSL